MDISLIEFIVYGLVCYTGVILLILSAFRETPTNRSQSIVRAMYLMISIIAAIMLSGSGTDIIMETSTISSTTTNLNSSEVWTETVTEDRVFTLQNPVWVTFHYMLAVVMLVYVILQILTLFTKIE